MLKKTTVFTIIMLFACVVNTAEAKLEDISGVYSIHSIDENGKVDPITDVGNFIIEDQGGKTIIIVTNDNGRHMEYTIPFNRKTGVIQTKQGMATGRFKFSGKGDRIKAEGTITVTLKNQRIVQKIMLKKIG